MVITPNPLFRRVYLYVAHIQPRAAHGALHHITPGHWTSSFMSIDTSHIFSLPTVGIRWYTLVYANQLPMSEKTSGQR